MTPAFVSDKKLSVCAPVYNEMEGITIFIDRVLEVLKANFAHYELVLVDDGSRDQTAAVIKAHNAPNTRLLRLSRNCGREIAMTAALEHAAGDFAIIMDSDMQDSPELIPELYAKAQEGYDVVYAARMTREGEGWMKKKTSTLFYRITSKLTGYKLPDNAGDYRIFSRRALTALLQLKEHNRYMKMLYAYIGFPTASVPFERQARTVGTTKYNWMKLIAAAIDAIVSFSTAPLRYVSIISLGVSLLLFLGSFFSLIFSGGPMALLIFFVSLLFSLLFVCVAVLAEYMGRMLTETKSRPLYFISEDTKPS